MNNIIKEPKQYLMNNGNVKTAKGPDAQGKAKVSSRKLNKKGTGLYEKEKDQLERKRTSRRAIEGASHDLLSSGVHTDQIMMSSKGQYEGENVLLEDLATPPSVKRKKVDLPKLKVGRGPLSPMSHTEKEAWMGKKMSTYQVRENVN
jgi:hypothetical protein